MAGRRIESRLRRVNFRWLLVLFFGVSHLSAATGDYPIKPIKVVVPFGPGGGSDTFVRIIQSGIKANDLMTRPFMVINVPGAGGTIGSRRVKNSFADGYTLLNLHDGILSAKHSGQTLYGPEAFTPIAATGRAMTMICVAGGSPFQTLREVMEAAKAKPGKVTFGANFGATSHFAGLRLEHMFAGSEFTFIPAGGGAKRFAAMKGDHLDVSTFTVAEFVGFREGGLRAVAILSEERHPAFPKVMTAKEQGIDVVWDAVQYWWAPKGTPADRVAYFARVLQSAMETKEVRAKFEELYFEPLFASGPALDDLIAEREARVAELSIRKPIELPNFPLATGVVLVLLGIVAGAREWRKADSVSRLAAGEIKPIGIGLGLLLLYAAALQSRMVPFWVVTLLFNCGLGWFLMRGGRQRPAALVTTALVVAVGCQLIFTRWLIVDLP